jgi:ornithine cyclodeaminase/alanine dehydrogenase-like protein (mu-crystallin family)
VRLELGEVLLDDTFERSPDRITLFNSVGLPIQDLAAVTALLDATGNPVS